MGKMKEILNIPMRNYPLFALRDLEDYAGQTFDWLAELHAVPYDTIVRWTVGCSTNDLYAESAFEDASYIDFVFHTLGYVDSEIILIEV